MLKARRGTGQEKRRQCTATSEAAVPQAAYSTPEASTSSLKTSIAGSQSAETPGSKTFCSTDAAIARRPAAVSGRHPLATACTTTLPRAVASTRSPQASTVSWQNRWFWLPPPTIRTVSNRRSVNSSNAARTQRCFSARLSRQQRTTSPSPSGSGCPLRRQYSRIALGMSPGSTNSGASGSTTLRNGVACSACATSSGQE